MGLMECCPFVRLLGMMYVGVEPMLQSSWLRMGEGWERKEAGRQAGRNFLFPAQIQLVVLPVNHLHESETPVHKEPTLR